MKNNLNRQNLLSKVYWFKAVLGGFVVSMFLAMMFTGYDGYLAIQEREAIQERLADIAEIRDAPYSDYFHYDFTRSTKNKYTLGEEIFFRSSSHIYKPIERMEWLDIKYCDYNDGEGYRSVARFVSSQTNLEPQDRNHIIELDDRTLWKYGDGSGRFLPKRTGECYVENKISALVEITESGEEIWKYQTVTSNHYLITQ